MSNNQLNNQVGGNHYKVDMIQPVEVTAILDWGYIQGAIFKYVRRYRYKNGLEDLRKALHYSKIGEQFSHSQFGMIDERSYTFISMYCRLMRCDNLQLLMKDIHEKRYFSVSSILERMIREYGE